MSNYLTLLEEALLESQTPGDFFSGMDSMLGNSFKRVQVIPKDMILTNKGDAINISYKYIGKSTDHSRIYKMISNNKKYSSGLNKLFFDSPFSYIGFQIKTLSDGTYVVFSFNQGEEGSY